MVEVGAPYWVGRGRRAQRGVPAQGSVWSSLRSGCLALRGLCALPHSPRNQQSQGPGAVTSVTTELLSVPFLAEKIRDLLCSGIFTALAEAPVPKAPCAPGPASTESGLGT